MIEEIDKRIITIIIEKIDRLTDLVNNHIDEIATNYLYSDSLQFEFEKIYEDTKKFSLRFIMTHPDLPIDYLRGIRNRIAHDYESVILKKLISTVTDDFPFFKNTLLDILNNDN